MITLRVSEMYRKPVRRMTALTVAADGFFFENEMLHFDFDEIVTLFKVIQNCIQFFFFIGKQSGIIRVKCDKEFFC